MTYKELMDEARKNIGPYCKACYVCDGRACGNSLPGPGSKGPGNGANRNYEKWQELCLNMDTIGDNSAADSSYEFYSKTLRMPVLAAPMGAMKLHYGEKYDDMEYNKLLVKACVDNGTMALLGDNPSIDAFRNIMEAALVETGGQAIPTIKPWNKEAIFERIDIAKALGVKHIAMDIDAAGLPFLKQLNPNAGSKTVEELKEIIDYAGLPFILKGIMTPKAAEKAIAAGVSAIVVSNHGGRVMPALPSTCEVLPSIVKQVAGRVKVIVDGGVRSGADVYRALALGAESVLIGRPVVTAIYGGGAEGLKLYLDKIHTEFIDIMNMTGTKKLSEIGSEQLF